VRGKRRGRIRSSRQNRKRRVRIRSDGHESLSSLRIQNPVLGSWVAESLVRRILRRGQGFSKTDSSPGSQSSQPLFRSLAAPKLPCRETCKPDAADPRRQPPPASTGTVRVRDQCRIAVGGASKGQDGDANGSPPQRTCAAWYEITAMSASLSSSASSIRTESRTKACGRTPDTA